MKVIKFVIVIYVRSFLFSSPEKDLIYVSPISDRGARRVCYPKSTPSLNQDLNPGFPGGW